MSRIRRSRGVRVWHSVRGVALVAFVSCLVSRVSCLASAADPPALKAELAREVIGPRQTLAEAQDYLEARVPRMPKPTTAAEWEKEAERLRKDVLDRVVFRGAARDWRDARPKVEWLD